MGKKLRTLVKVGAVAAGAGAAGKIIYDSRKKAMEAQKEERVETCLLYTSEELISRNKVLTEHL